MQDLIHKLCEALSVAANTQPSLKHHMTSDDSHVTANHEADKPVEDQSLTLTQSVPTTPGPYSPALTTEQERLPTVGAPHSDSELVVKRDYVTQRSKVMNEVMAGQETSSKSSLPTLQALAVLSSVSVSYTAHMFV